MQNDISTHISRLTKADAKTAARKKHIPTPILKIREQARIDSQENRFKVVNCYRTLENDDETNSSNVTVVDIVKQNVEEKANEQITSDTPNETIPVMNITDITDTTDDFVYDLYLSNELEQIDNNIVNYMFRFVITGQISIYGTMI